LSPHQTTTYHHKSVLFQEAIDVLGITSGSLVVDCTLGGGGHTGLMLQRVGPTGRVVAFDRDMNAISEAQRRFADDVQRGRLTLVHTSFGDILSQLDRLAVVGKVQAILADIGVSSHHLDVAERGFSFASDGPLDMRMDQSRGISAADFLAGATEEEIAAVLWKFGEEPKSRFIAKLICERRHTSPFTRTTQLADLIATKIFYKEASRKHPATRTFQALRIFINNELGELESLLAAAPKIVSAKGVLGIISFHSLEDRLVKEALLALSGKTARASVPRDIPLTAAELGVISQGLGEIIKPFPLVPSAAELSANPRARSAKLRAIRFF
jgi:16S rRNA (cytosine1402-N4)-methyltransferase